MAAISEAAVLKTKIASFISLRVAWTGPDGLALVPVPGFLISEFHTRKFLSRNSWNRALYWGLTGMTVPSS